MFKSRSYQVYVPSHFHGKTIQMNGIRDIPYVSLNTRRDASLEKLHFILNIKNNLLA